MKRTVAVLAALLLLFSACGAAESGDDGPAADGVSEIEAGDVGEAGEQLREPEEQPVLYAMHEMSGEERRYYDAYIAPLLYTGMLNLSWSGEDARYLSTGPDGLSAAPNLLFAFEDLAGRNKMEALWETHGATLPAGEVEVVLTEYFPFAAEQLREMLAGYYDAARGVYNYEGGRGGGPLDMTVTGVGEDGALIRVAYTAYYDYRDEDAAFGGTYSGLLTLRREGERVLYWSVEVDEEPRHKRDVALREDYPAL